MGDPPTCKRCGVEYTMEWPNTEPTTYCNACAHVIAENAEASERSLSMKPFGTILREAREAKGITLRALAKLLNVSAPFWSDVEHSRRLPAKLEPVAEALGMDINKLRAADPRNAKRSELEDLKLRVARLESTVAKLDSHVTGLDVSMLGVRR